MHYKTSQLVALVLIRLAIGWHFLYEGGVKTLKPHWTAKAYLLASVGFMKRLFGQSNEVLYYFKILESKRISLA